MKRLILLALVAFCSISYAQEKNYDTFFEPCEKETSKGLCIMMKIEKEVQELYKTYRETGQINYDLENITLKYTVLKNGSIKLESILGNIEHFKPIIIKLFTKLPKTSPLVENGKERDSLSTTSFYLYPRTKK